MSFTIDGQTYEDEFDYVFKQIGGTSVPMKEQGNIDLNARPSVKNEDGSISTVRSMSVGFDDGEVLIPTVARDGSRILSNDEAIQQYKDTGEHLGKFHTPEDANKYGEMLHKSQEEQYTPRIGLESPTEPVDALKLTGSGNVAPPKETSPEPSKSLEKKTFENDWNRMVDDIIAASPKWRGDSSFTQSPNFEDRRDKPIDSTPVNPSAKDVREHYGDDINPKEFVMDPLAHDLGVNRLNEMIVRKESSPKNKPKVIELDPGRPKDDIDELLEKIDRWKKKRK